MILHPPILALLAGSLLSGFMLCLASWYAFVILRKWDLSSGSELQLMLERRTYLISTLVANVCAFQLLSLFLFVYIADDLSRLFIGAMCAAGTLNVNRYGYPALTLQIASFLLSGVWLILNAVDNRGYDYPLIKKKYGLLVLIAPLVVTQTAVLIQFFVNLRPDIITSCCSTIFSAESVSTGIDGLSAIGVASRPVVFFVLMGATVLLGLRTCFSGGRGAYAFGLMSGVTFFVSFMALISVFSLYFYELPTHHCPFCIMQPQYHGIGYPLYLSLFGGAVTGIGTAVIAPFRKIASLAAIVPGIQRRLAAASVLCYTIFTVIITIALTTSNLIMTGG